MAEGKYTFKVNKSAGKNQIKKAIELFFGVKVAGVKTITLRGKTRRARGMKGKQVKGADWKKALVLLKEGEKLDIFETPATEVGSEKKDKKEKKEKDQSKKE